MSWWVKQAWASARLAAAELSNDEVDKLVEWRLSDPRYSTKLIIANQRAKGRITMQRQWTIEARMDFSDSEKNAVIDNVFRQAAAHINATLALLKDGQEPQVVVFSEDFFHGHQDIKHWDNPLGEALAAKGDSPPTEIASDLLEAARQMDAEREK